MKSWLKSPCFIVFAAFFLLAGFGCDGGSSSGGGCDEGPTYDTYFEGPYTTTQNLSTGPSRDSGLFYPTNTPSGTLLPIFVWGCGAGSDPGDYVDHMNHIASWGFLAMAEVSTGDGTELVAAIDWLTAQNANRLSPLYQKLDLTRIAAGGHSQGSISTFAMASDPRLSTTIHVAGGSFDGRGAYNLRNPAAYICGEDDFLATPNAEEDYRVTTVPVFMTIIADVDHMSAARAGLPAITAWLLWHLKGETQRMGDFLDYGGEFTIGMWDSKSKNW